MCRSAVPRSRASATTLVRVTTTLPAHTVRSVRLRLVPWRPRWRTGKARKPPDGLVEVLGLIDEFLSLLARILLVVLPVVVVLVLGVALLGLEMLVLLPVGLLLVAGRLCRLRPWILVVTNSDGTRTLVEVVGVRAMLRRRRELLGGCKVHAPRSWSCCTGLRSRRSTNSMIGAHQAADAPIMELRTEYA